MWWFEEGGEVEDNDSRPLNHFFDPLQPWDEAGLDIPVMPTQTAALVWAQDQSAEKENMSWAAARENFYQALVKRQDALYARTFQALGQLMHLVADAAVPAHVRNDQHLSHELIPDWVEENVKGGPDPYEQWTAQPEVWPNLDYTAAPVDAAIFGRAVSSGPDHTLAPARLSALWDQNRYSGANPEVTREAPAEAGLAEYTNANFCSRDTIFSGYNQPSMSATMLTHIDWSQTDTVLAEDGKTDNRKYIWSFAGGNRNIRLAAGSYLSYDCIAGGYYSETPFVLDENIHADYASLLIPRAVGYSAALLNYFFSGTLEITPPQRYAYALVDDADPAFLDGNGNKTEQFFTELQAGVRLTTPDDISQDGDILAIARYKRRTDYLPDLANEPPTDSSMAAFSYSVSAPLSVYLQSEMPAELTFDFSANPIPAGITDLSLQIIFKGALQGPIALGVKDLNEPMFFKIANSTDLYYHDGTLKGPADFAPGAPEHELFHYPVSGSLGLYPAAGPFSGYSVDFSLPAGRFSKIAFLTEGEGVDIRLTSSNLPTVDLSFSAVINQASLFTRALVWREDSAHQNYSWFAVFPQGQMDGIWEAPWPALQFPALPVTMREQ